MKLDKQTYQRLLERKSPKSPLWRDCLLAFLSQRAAPAGAPSIAERDDLLSGQRGPVFRIHVAPGEDGGHG